MNLISSTTKSYGHRDSSSYRPILVTGIKYNSANASVLLRNLSSSLGLAVGNVPLWLHSNLALNTRVLGLLLE